jgi:DNA adenine methylase
MNLLSRLPGGRVWLNDLDPGIAAIWSSVVKYPAKLQAVIRQFTPSVDRYRQFREDLRNGVRNGNPKAVVDRGFRKLALHQMSFSGLGEMAGGPLGGWSQESQYKIDSRWSPKQLVKSIDKYHVLLARFQVKCTSLDFSAVLTGGPAALIYLDPPYFHAGSVCYRHAFTWQDHDRLAQMLRTTEHHWVLSYDDCPEARRLYRWARIRTVPVKYSIAGSQCKSELLITKE